MKAFFDHIRAEFGPLNQGQVDGFNHILNALSDAPTEEAAYILATAWHETGKTMQPVREAYGKSDEETIRKLDFAWNAGQLTWVRTPYWREGWFGRGYVQLTHKTNYQKASEKLGADMVQNPSLALDPVLAAQVLVRGSREGWFTGKKLSDYLPGDYVNARRVINGTDRAQLIAGYAEVFEAAFRKEASETVPYREMREGPPKTPLLSREPNQSPSIVAALIVAATALFGAIATLWDKLW